MRSQMRALFLIVFALLPFIGGAQEVDFFPEVEASFPGGEMKLLEFVNANLNNPLRPEDDNCIVFVAFVVDINGEISNMKVERGCSDSLNNEALRIVSLMPEFIPGSTKGNPVATYYRLLVRFKAPSRKEWRKKSKN